jgi:hypothetical protein
MLRAGLQWQAQEEEKCKGCCVFEVSHRSTPHALLINVVHTKRSFAHITEFLAI